MPTLRTNIQKGKFSNYGSSKFSTPTKNTQYFAASNRRVKQPTMRGSFPRAVKWSLDDEGITNRRSDYNRSINLSQSASRPSRNFEFGAAQTIATANFSNGIYDGNAARKFRPVSVPKTQKAAPKERSMHAVQGDITARSNMKTAAMSPMIVTLAKVAAVLVVLVAVLAFIRVGMTSATVSNGLASQEISKAIDGELVSKNALEVQDSSLANSGRIRQVASQYSLIAPSTITVFDIGQDVLAYDDNNHVSLVESLDRAAKSNP